MVSFDPHQELLQLVADVKGEVLTPEQIIEGLLLILPPGEAAELNEVGALESRRQREDHLGSNSPTESNSNLVVTMAEASDTDPRPTNDELLEDDNRVETRVSPADRFPEDEESLLNGDADEHSGERMDTDEEKVSVSDGDGREKTGKASPNPAPSKSIKPAEPNDGKRVKIKVHPSTGARNKDRKSVKPPQGRQSRSRERASTSSQSSDSGSNQSRGSTRSHSRERTGDNPFRQTEFPGGLYIKGLGYLDEREVGELLDLAAQHQDKLRLPGTEDRHAKSTEEERRAAAANFKETQRRIKDAEKAAHEAEKRSRDLRQDLEARRAKQGTKEEDGSVKRPPRQEDRKRERSTDSAGEKGKDKGRTSLPIIPKPPTRSIATPDPEVDLGKWWKHYGTIEVEYWPRYSVDLPNWPLHLLMDCVEWGLLLMEERPVPKEWASLSGPDLNHRIRGGVVGHLEYVKTARRRRNIERGDRDHLILYNKLIHGTGTMNKDADSQIEQALQRAMTDPKYQRARLPEDTIKREIEFFRVNVKKYRACVDLKAEEDSVKLDARERLRAQQRFVARQAKQREKEERAAREAQVRAQPGTPDRSDGPRPTYPSPEAQPSRRVRTPSPAGGWEEVPHGYEPPRSGSQVARAHGGQNGVRGSVRGGKRGKHSPYPPPAARRLAPGKGRTKPPPKRR